MRYKAGALVDVLEVRAQLYELRNHYIRRNNDHLVEAIKREGAGHDKFKCPTCCYHSAAIGGIEHAVRRFGGLPR
jgi:hypothetical protein